LEAEDSKLKNEAVVEAVRRERRVRRVSCIVVAKVML
jgi:hypothetical protein